VKRGRLRSGAKFCRVVRHQVSEGARRNSGDVRNRGCDECGLTDCGSPCIERHIHDACGHYTEQFLTRFVRRNLFDVQRAADYATDDGYLFEPGQRVGPGLNIVCSGGSVFAQGVDCHASYVSLVNRCSGGGRWGPAHDVAGTNLRSPPAQNVAANMPGRRTVHCSPEFSMRRSICLGRIGLLEERARCFVRGGKENVAPSMLRDALHRGSNSGRRGGPHEEYRVDVCRQESSVSGRAGSRRTSGICGGKRLASGLRVSARPCAPFADS
jgi:hypothetical protein